MKGSLPWQSIKTKDRKEKHKILYKEKSSIDLNFLCQGLPKEFVYYFEQIRLLDYDEEPRYMDYINIFKQLSKNLSSNPIMDWEKENEVVKELLVHRL